MIIGAKDLVAREEPNKRVIDLRDLDLQSSCKFAAPQTDEFPNQEEEETRNTFQTTFIIALFLHAVERTRSTAKARDMPFLSLFFVPNLDPSMLFFHIAIAAREKAMVAMVKDKIPRCYFDSLYEQTKEKLGPSGLIESDPPIALRPSLRAHPTHFISVGSIFLSNANTCTFRFDFSQQGASCTQREVGIW